MRLNRNYLGAHALFLRVIGFDDALDPLFLGRGVGLFQALQFILCFLPFTGLSLGGQGSVVVRIEGEDIGSEVGRDLIKVVLRQQIEKVRVGFVCQYVFASVSGTPGIEIGIGEMQLLGALFREALLVVL